MPGDRRLVKDDFVILQRNFGSQVAPQLIYILLCRFNKYFLSLVAIYSQNCELFFCWELFRHEIHVEISPAHSIRSVFHVGVVQKYTLL
jgi:hypothetical protein